MSGVGRMILRRVLLLVPLLLGVSFVVFVVVQLMPGDPAASALGVFADQEARERFARQNNLDDPIWVRFPAFLGQILQGDLGTSLISGESVTTLIGTALPVTLQLAALAMTLAIGAALAIGILSAVYRDGWIDAIFRMISISGLAVPSFWIGLLAIQFFAIRLGWLPSGGYVPPGESLGLWLQSLILPAASMALPVAAQLSRVVRASMVEELEKDYVRTARGSGLPEVVVIGRNVMRNALISPLTVVGLQFGALLSGAILLETIYSVPGMGRLLINSVQQNDLAIIQGLVLATTAMVVIVNLIVDISYILLNPRIREA